MQNNMIWIHCKADDQFFIEGFIIGEPSILHFSYVRASRRSSDIELNLINKVCGTVKYSCDHARAGALFTPYLFAVPIGT